jgi:hypothetical protein
MQQLPVQLGELTLTVNACIASVFAADLLLGLKLWVHGTPRAPVTSHAVSSDEVHGCLHACCVHGHGIWCSAVG